MYGFVINTCNSLIRGLGAVLNAILALFPNDPFQAYILTNSTLTKYLGYVNYFVPVADMLVILSAWCTAIATYYLHQIVARWIKLIE